MGRKSAEESPVMGDEGARVKARRERLGMNRKELAGHADVNRATLTAIEEGQGFRMESLTKIERALDGLELEMGVHVPPAESTGLVSFEIRMPGGGATVVVSGPVADADKLAESVRRMLGEPDGHGE